MAMGMGSGGPIGFAVRTGLPCASCADTCLETASMQRQGSVRAASRRSQGRRAHWKSASSEMSVSASKSHSGSNSLRLMLYPVC